jgi:hypothetical protein
MKKLVIRLSNIKQLYFTLILSVCFFSSFAQTEIDAIMMSKNNFCTGLMYGHNNWKNYWEGSFRRDNQNLGTVSSQMIGLMGNYGFKDNLNFLFSIPHISTKASAGTLAGSNGIQDLSLFVKWMPIEQKLGKGDFSFYTILGGSTPMSNYVKDYLPLSIGLGSTTLSGRLMLDYQVKNIFITGSAAYFLRGKVSIDRQAYYTTQMHYTNEVLMPATTNFNIRTGYRSGHIIAEAVLDIMQTNGGFDITKNNMPFLSNKMNGTRIGANFKYTFSSIDGLSIIGNAMYTVAGRNIGQTTSLSGGVFYIIDFTKKKTIAKIEDGKN